MDESPAAPRRHETWHSQRFLAYVERALDLPEAGWGPPGAAVAAWIAAHIAIVSVVAVALAEDIGRGSAWQASAGLVWLALSSGAVVKATLAMVSERFARSASRGLPIPRQVRLGTALAATAGVSLVVPVNSRAAFVTALVFMMGARLAGFDAWSGLLRSAGFYRRAALSWSGARVTVIWLVFLTVWFLVIWGWFVDGVLDRGLGVQRLVPRTTQLAQTIVVVAVVPAVVGVCELISGIARHEAKVQSLLVETARARQSALTARRIHQRAASLIPVLRMSTGDQLHDAIDELDVNLRQLLLEDRITAGDARFEDCLDRAVKRARLVNVDLVTRVEGADPTDLVPQGCGSVLDEAIFELVANAAKAGAARITVTIAVTTDALRVDVTDDAGGFDVRNARGRGGGLSQLERDLADICGTLEIHSDRGFTLVRVRIPRSIEYEDAP